MDLEKGAGVFVESFRVSKFLKGIKHKGPQTQKFFFTLTTYHTNTKTRLLGATGRRLFIDLTAFDPENKDFNQSSAI